MKTALITLCLFVTYFVTAQKITYYDYKWKECDISRARFVSVTLKTDSGWLVNDSYLATKKLQKKGLYKDSVCKIKHGQFAYFYPNQQISSVGHYSNGEKDGVWLSFHYSGMMRDSFTYDKGQAIGTAMGWHNNGSISDSLVHGVNGVDVHVQWFDNGTPSSSGRNLNGKKEGKWRFFHSNGNTAALEQYSKDVLLSRIYYDENGNPLADTASRDCDAMYKGNETKWRNYLLNNLQFPRDVKLVNTDIITVVIDATIDEDGNVEDAFVEIPFEKQFDAEALRVMKRSAKWEPAIRNNRRVKMYIRQPVTFSQHE